MEHIQDIDLLELSKKITYEWKNIARYLTIDDAEISGIRKDNFNCTQEQIYQMLYHWKKKKGRDATNKILAQALIKGNRKDLADELSSRQGFGRGIQPFFTLTIFILVIALPLATVYSPTGISSLTDVLNRFHDSAATAEDDTRRIFTGVDASFEESATSVIRENVHESPLLVSRKETKVAVDDPPSQKVVEKKDEDFRDVFLFLKKNVAKEWKDIARYLGVDNVIITQIEMRWTNDISECIYEVLDHWRKTKSGDATIEKLKEALCSAGVKHLADKIEKGEYPKD